jgi:ATP-dependent 26S proteasome regulatory subunit
MSGVSQVAAFSDQVWTVGDEGLERWALDGRSLGAPVRLEGPGVLEPSFAGVAAARWSGEPVRMWLDDLGTFREVDVVEDARQFAGRRQLAVSHGEARLGTVAWKLPSGSQLVAAAALFDGAALGMIVARGGVREAWSAAVSGAVQQRIAIPAGALRLAARRGVLVVHTGPRSLEVIDLRFGTLIGRVIHDADITDVALDHDGGLLAITSGEECATITVQEALRAAPVVVSVTDQVEDAPSPARPITEAAPSRTELRASAREALPSVVLTALSPRTRVAAVSRDDATAQLDRELALIGAWVLVAIAEGWDTRRLGYANESVHPYEHEVAAILGLNRGFAPDHLAGARASAEEHEVALRADPRRRGPDTPLGALAAELGLSSLAIDILLVVTAPTIWGDLARLYGILANDTGRPIVDEQLVATILSRVSRHDIARELDPRGPLVGMGAIQLAGDRPRPFANLVVDPVIVSRLCAEVADLSDVVSVPSASTRLEAIEMPRPALIAALTALSRPGGRPPRVVVRGRGGSGRRTLLAALAREANRELAVIDAARLPRSPEGFAAALRVVLRRVHLAGLVPCIVGLDQLAFGDRTIADVIAEPLRAHPGPLALATSYDFAAPFDPGYIAIDLPILDETERLALWKRALAAAGLWVRDETGLAARYRIGPGVIHRAIASVEASDRDASDAIEAYVRQTRDARLANVARRVDRTASWANLVLPSDVLDSLRELVGRVRHRRQVYEQWGMADTLATSRGITALFSGPPGTGKTLVAGVIARELGLDLYQVDLSKVMSKWIGETERNLSTIFDAAEDGQVILLFDEADSLFAKRTEVRSSNDRYANLEVNYLLQRLDSFEGIAVLTTNFGTSIDPAFKRRMSFRLTFPFPDEETREELWRVHLPPQLPIAGDLAFAKLARKYQLAGGYIRNACVRAAFLAAQEEMVLDQAHLERAVALEFAELGKLSSSGALE